MVGSSVLKKNILKKDPRVKGGCVVSDLEIAIASPSFASLFIMVVDSKDKRMEMKG